MTQRSRALLALLGATIMLGALVGTASANRLATSSQNITATWTAMNFAGPFGTVTCPVTLSGSLHSRTITKTAGALIGFINRATANSGGCSGGSASVRQSSLPWHVRYLSFSGTLPIITSIRTNIIGAGFEIISGELGPCSVTTTATSPATGTFNRNTSTGALTSVAVGGTIATTCPFVSGSLSGTSNSLTPITVTLI